MRKPGGEWSIYDSNNPLEDARESPVLPVIVDDAVAASEVYRLSASVNQTTPPDEVSYRALHASSGSIGLSMGHSVAQSANVSPGLDSSIANLQSIRGGSSPTRLGSLIPGLSSDISPYEEVPFVDSSTSFDLPDAMSLVTAGPSTTPHPTSHHRTATYDFATVPMRYGRYSNPISPIWPFDDTGDAGLPGWINFDPPHSFSPSAPPCSPDFGFDQPEWQSFSRAQPEVQGYRKPLDPSFAWEIIAKAMPIVSRGGSVARTYKLPPAEILLESVQSLLPMPIPEDEFGQSLNIFDTDITSTNSLMPNLLFSLVNNSAGLEGIPVAAISMFVDQNETIRSSIREYLPKAPPSLSRSLAEVLFKGAIEAGSLEAVSSLLKSGLIDPNAIVFVVEDHRLTALERAAALRQKDIIIYLLQAGADINKTYAHASYEWTVMRGPLHWAIKPRYVDEPIDVDLFNKILDSGAIVHAEHLRVAFDLGNEPVINKLISRLSPTEHLDYFKGDILARAAQNLRNNLGLAVGQQLISACQRLHNGQCINPKKGPFVAQLSLAAAHAARRANIELLQLLFPHVDQQALDMALPAAIKSENHDTIRLLLDEGAEVGADATDCTEWDDRCQCRDDPRGGDGDWYRTTALAEAIRTRDDDLIVLVEQEGALSDIINPGHLIAALHAVCDVGDLIYLRKILQQISNPGAEIFQQPMVSAIIAENENIVWEILELGFDVTGDGLLQVAIQSTSRSLVAAIMDCCQPYRDRSWRVLSAAIRRGDISILRDLIYIGLDIDCEALTEAVRQGSKPMINVLLELLGTSTYDDISPSPFYLYGDKPLAAAVQSKDTLLIKHLLERGANPADVQAFTTALSLQYTEALNLLLQGFRKRYPYGISHFGAEILQLALKMGNQTFLDLCLSVKLGINSLSNKDGLGPEKLTALGFVIKEYQGTRLDLITKLLDAGEDINAIVNNSYKARRQTAILEAIETKSLVLVRLLVNKGANINQPARLGLRHTPLQKACDVGSYSITCFLLEQQADINAEPALKGGGTAFQFAAKSGSLQIAKHLLKHNADITAPPSRIQGRSAIEYAAEYGRISMVQMLCNLPGALFTAEQYNSAIALAQKGGYIACAESLRRLQSDKDWSRFMVDLGIS